MRHRPPSSCTAREWRSGLRKLASTPLPSGWNSRQSRAGEQPANAAPGQQQGCKAGIVAIIPGSARHNGPHDRTPPQTLPLAGVRVLDLSRVLAGPLVHADAGRPGRRRDQVERPLPRRRRRRRHALGPAFPARPRGPATPPRRPTTWAPTATKRSITVDIARPEGQALIRRLAAAAATYSWRTSRSATWPATAWTAPACSRSTRASSTARSPASARPGPTATARGYDYAVQGMGGLMSVTGPSRQRSPTTPGGGPQKVGVAVADLFTGMYATPSAILAALRHRDLTGRPGDRHGAARHPGGDARQPRRQLPRHRRAPQRRQCAEHRALPGVPGGRRAT